ncbi:olfactory receptor 6F1-like [Bombina bombina]|uniref:olfactory receptor 6F1-like n=1 Tax=Bombina bombina TaxID=8345 RepID=UPI00235B0AB7|nr:olfactory receptor 6F1-like [Bombina bombina]
MPNNITQFLLLGFPDFQFWHYGLFGIFLTMYLLTIAGNITIVSIVRHDDSLHTPMYFFISNLSFIEIMFTTVTVPKILALVIGYSKSISFHSCLIQFYFFFSLGSTECCLLAAMSYDRYIAVCNPLHYSSIMNRSVCLYIVLACWVEGIFITSIHTFCIANLKFCGKNTIHHFFCDLSPLLKLSCENTSVIEFLNFLTACVIVLCSFSLTLFSYIRIIMTVLAIPSSTGKRKTFSTCASHLIVVLMFFGTVAFVYVRPRVSTDFEANMFISMLFIVVTPALNPFIYSLRNKEVKYAIKKLIRNSRLLYRQMS